MQQQPKHGLWSVQTPAHSTERTDHSTTTSTTYKAQTVQLGKLLGGCLGLRKLNGFIMNRRAVIQLPALYILYMYSPIDTSLRNSEEVTRGVWGPYQDFYVGNWNLENLPYRFFNT